MDVFELDIPSLTSNGIDLGDDDTFSEVNELVCLSMIDEYVLIEMLILLNITSLSIAM